jgi:DNA-binding NarL/FixJ family response regulator
MRVAIADDSVLLREGLSRLLAEAGIETVASVGDGDSLVAAVELDRPDVALIDIRMPPTFTHEGAQAAAALRARWPSLGILLLSQSIESTHALALARANPTGFGYLLKDRVLDVAALVDAVERVAAGGTVLDPDVVAHFLGRTAARDRLTSLTEREQEVLALMAEGRSNRGIGRLLVVNEKTVEAHISSIFSKLSLVEEANDHRRVLAVRAWLTGQH